MKHNKEWHTCDRCGKEIQSIISPTLTLHSLFLPQNYDLCPECVRGFRRFMENMENEQNV